MGRTWALSALFGCSSALFPWGLGMQKGTWISQGTWRGGEEGEFVVCVWERRRRAVALPSCPLIGKKPVFINSSTLQTSCVLLGIFISCYFKKDLHESNLFSLFGYKCQGAVWVVVWFLFLMGRQINEFPLLSVSYCTLEKASSLVVCYQESLDVLCAAIVSNIRIKLLE